MDSKSTGKLKASDRLIAEAVRDVEVPEGLAERILARFETVQDLAATAVTEATLPATLPLLRPRRRRWLVGSAAAMVACAASFVGAWLLWPTSPAELGADGVMELARSLYESLGATRAKLVTDEVPPTRYEMGPYVITGARTRWRPVDGELAGRRGAVYELLSGRNERAQLFVVDLQGPLGSAKFQWLPQSPMQNISTTGGYTSVAWTDGIRVFVLVVRGDENALRAFVRDPGTMA